MRDALAAELNAARAQLARHTRGRRFLDTLYVRRGTWRAAGQCAGLPLRGGDGRYPQCRGAGLPRAEPAQDFSARRDGALSGRMCGLTVTELLADAHGQTPTAIGYYRLRACP